MPETSAALLGRRRVLLGAGSVGAAALLDALVVEPAWLAVTEHAVPIAELPQALEGFTLAQITDAHLRGIGHVERALVHAVRARQIRLVVLTGDIVDRLDTVPLLAELCAGLRDAGATLIATLGNWEHWAGFTAVGLAREYERLGARLLVDDALDVDGVRVAATDDGFAGAPRWDHTLAALGRLARTAGPKLLLTHSPAMFDRVPLVAPRFDLSLAGHTHGGQLRLGPWAPLVPPGSGRFVHGFYDTAVGRAYVSRGTGTSVVPARFGCRPELAVFRFTRG